MHEKLEVATGCTEPIAIAYAAATARKHIEGDIEKIDVYLSGNMIKNAMVVGIPGTNKTGIDFVAALGAYFGDAGKKLEVISGLSNEQFEYAEKQVKAGVVSVNLSDKPEKLYIDVCIKTDKGSARAVIAGAHTNIVLIMENDDIVYSKEYHSSLQDQNNSDSGITLDDIFDFAINCDIKDLESIETAINLNSSISKEGLSHRYGLNVGKDIYDKIQSGTMADDMTNYIIARTSAGSDARMAGADMPVMANSGSGNQGIAATMPAVAAAEYLGATHEKTIRAAALSNLVAIYIKLKFGVLSAFCGAVVSAAGSAAAITYLMGGKIEQIKKAIQNTLGNVAGVICDGAKSDCALKIAACTNAATLGAQLAMADKCISGREGFVENNVEYTINNFSILGNTGTFELDKLLLNMILNKKN